jgi:hypothetical protein
MQKSLLIFLICFLLNGIQVDAQRYGTALGLRLGNSNINRTIGVSLQQRVKERITIEGIVQTDFSRNTTLSVLAQKHYYGGGLSFGSEESFVKNPSTKEINHTYGNATTGVDLIAGVEMTLANAVISLDYKPNINLVGREEFYRGQVGLSVRTVLVKSKEQKKKQRQRKKAKQANSQAPKRPFSELFKR